MEIVNLKNSRSGEWIVVCDRRSTLGNPFWMPQETSRRLVTLGFRRYAWRILQGLEPIIAAQTIANEMKLTIASTWQSPDREQWLAALNALKPDDQLGCHCSPLDCHCEQLVRAWAYLHPEEAAIAQIQGCAYCHRLGTKLCDGRIHNQKTCDRPMCADCAFQSGSFIACVRDRGRRRSVTDSTDLCRTCKEQRDRDSRQF